MQGARRVGSSPLAMIKKPLEFLKALWPRFKNAASEPFFCSDSPYLVDGHLFIFGTMLSPKDKVWLQTWL